MIKYEIYNPEKTYVFMSGNLATPEEVARQYPASKTIKFVVETDDYGESMYGFQSFTSLKTLMGIDSSLNDKDALAEMEAIRNAPPEVDETPTAEERIAAAMEFQNMMSIPDETTAG